VVQGHHAILSLDGSPRGAALLPARFLP
jgi:hypothetical protein